MKLATKLMILFLLLTTIPLAIVGYLAYDNGRRAIEQDTLNRLLSTTIYKEAEFKRWVKDNERSLRDMAIRPGIRENAAVMVSHDPSTGSVRDPADPAYQAAYGSILEHRLSPTLEEEGGFLDLSILRGDDGLILVSTDKSLEGKYRESELFFVEGRSRTYVENVTYCLTLGEAVMHISTPIRDGKGNLIAVLAGHADLAEMSKIMEQRSGLSASEETYLVNKFNFFITEPRFGEGYALKKALHTDGVQACLEHNEGIGFYDDYRGVPVIGAYRWLPERELCILTEVDQAEAYAPIVALRNTVLGIGVGVGLLVALLGLLVARTITAPVQQLVKGAEEIGRGNLAYRTEMKGRDEIGHLSRAFDQMAETLKTTMSSRDELNREIAERKRVEEALRETRDYLENLINYANAPIIVWDSDFKITRFNHAFEHLTDYTADEVIGQELSVLFPGASRDESLSKIARTLAGEYWEAVEIPILRKDGDARIALWNSANIYAEDGTTFLATIAQGTDITERKQAAEALKEYSERLEEMVEERTKALRDAQEQLVRSEKLAVLGQLAGGVGHELRNPLGAVKNAAYFLRMVLQKPEPDVAEMLRILDREVDNCDRIISSLLDFARPRELAPRRVDLPEVIEEALARSTAPNLPAQAGNVEVLTHYTEALPLITADPDQLGLVFGNLIRNAVQAMPGGGRLTITAAYVEGGTVRHPQSAIRIQVSDTGVGISEEHLGKIFEPLFTTKAKGIGLGLAVSKTLVERHGGTIEVESEAGKGSTFTVRLPLAGERGS